LEYICVFEYTCTLHSFSQIYSNLLLYKMKWNNLFFNLLPKLYSNTICKNIMKIFRKFEVGYSQTCTSLESSTMWHPKGGQCNVLSPHFKFELDDQGVWFCNQGMPLGLIIYESMKYHNFWNNKLHNNRRYKVVV
jgi:hypothetical protein